MKRHVKIKLHQKVALNISTAGIPVRRNHQLTFLTVYKLFCERLFQKAATKTPQKSLWKLKKVF